MHWLILRELFTSLTVSRWVTKTWVTKKIFLFFLIRSYILCYLGTIHYFKGIETKIRDKWIICSKKSRKCSKKDVILSNGQKNSLDTVKDVKSSLKINQCTAFYKFIFDENNGKMSFEKCNENHDHPLGLTSIDLTQKMIDDIRMFNKRSRIIDIKESLEKKYYVQLEYQTIYREFRKIYPRFGNEDANNLLKILSNKNIIHKIDIDETNHTIKKLIFATPQMLNNYKLYGDIMLIDSTYRVNHYNIPLIVYSGVDSGGRNVIFGLSVVNDETEETHQWCFREFFSIHQKLPQICITDQDLALMAVLNKNYPQVTHLLCQWHILQNLKKHFSFLQSMNLKNIYDKILTLPFISKTDIFERTYEEVHKSLLSKKYTKSVEYLQRVYGLKLKWSTCYSPSKFPAGIHTTSRIESINSIIKHYVNSNSEISDLFDFILNFEKSLIYKLETEESKKQNHNNIHPILQKIQLQVSEYVLSLHIEQFLLCSRHIVDTTNLFNSNIPDENPKFKVKNIDSKDEESFRLVTLQNNKYECECLTLFRA